MAISDESIPLCVQDSRPDNRTAVQDAEYCTAVINSLQQVRPVFCKILRSLLFSMVNLSKYQGYVLPYTSRTYNIYRCTNAK